MMWPFKKKSQKNIKIEVMELDSINNFQEICTDMFMEYTHTTFFNNENCVVISVVNDELKSVRVFVLIDKIWNTRSKK